MDGKLKGKKKMNIVCLYGISTDRLYEKILVRSNTMRFLFLDPNHKKSRKIFLCAFFVFYDTSTLFVDAILSS